MDLFPKKPNLDFLGKRRMFFAISATAIAISLLTPLVRKPNWGIDFAGGTELQVKFAEKVDVGDVRKAIEGSDIGDANIQQYGDADANEYLIRVGRASLYTNEQFAKDAEPKLRTAIPGLAEGRAGIEYNEAEGDQVTLTAKEGGLTTDGVRGALEQAGFRIQDVRSIVDGKTYSVLFKGVGEKVEQALATKFGEGKFTVQRVEQVGAAVGNELKWAAIKSMVLAILLILLYVGFRFDFRFAPGGVLALAHDAIIVIGFYTVTGAEINTNTIAAVLTIIGFSINDTIVIFDRVRENMQKYQGRELEKVINDSLNESLSRTILTTLTVILSLGGLIFFTVGTLREFSLAMLVGLIAGTYSTMYIASPLVLWLEDVMKARRVRAENQPKPPRVAEAK
jgi:preprotein translocase subunit SecF